MFFPSVFFLGGGGTKKATHNAVKPVSRYRYNYATYEPKTRGFCSYGHLSVITGYKWDYIFYKWGYKYL